MKKLLLLALIALGAWNYYQKQSTPKPIVEPATRVLPDYTVPIQKARDVAGKQSFRCDGRQHCSQMNSRVEAEFFLRNCPDTKMDGDRDGIPCENDSRF